jgi:hypothetical protein
MSHWGGGAFTELKISAAGSPREKLGVAAAIPTAKRTGFAAAQPRICHCGGLVVSSAGFRRSFRGLASMKTLVALLVALGVAGSFVTPVFADPTDQESCENQGMVWDPDTETCS